MPQILGFGQVKKLVFLLRELLFPVNLSKGQVQFLLFSKKTDIYIHTWIIFIKVTCM